MLIPMYPTSSFVLISESLRETRGFALHRTTVLASSLAVVMAPGRTSRDTARQVTDLEIHLKVANPVWGTRPLIRQTEHR